MIIGLIDRHAARDWGDLNAEDKSANDADHSHAEGWLFSSYDTEEHGTIWAITEGCAAMAAVPSPRFCSLRITETRRSDSS
ncbi:hypothetical protein [Vulcanococcus limneticus]|uniref:hypothetical protein n=1 Tax=Vulcanococcus limneticus TaxID=2170428 RepID=UPI000B992182|nr:hypothetical protein [Vulcanococcus limneticus]MCP9791700.1 hypothetical protein [Vulcanococcus limneticus MW73D5]MCP9893616.1 hypothetical protein [Vulcanococcus limneticus Candia 3F8]MCP9897149.1 hypothetical protein [Vulcanococcus limneticus Candia 3B3]